jgi:hypothetical protein
MRRFPIFLRIPLALILVLAIAVGGCYAWFNWYIHSEGFRQEIEKRISKVLGAEVHLGGVVVVPMNQLDALDVTIPTGDPAIAEPVVQVPRLNGRFDLSRYFDGDLVVDSLEIESPRVRLRENPGGNVAVAPWVGESAYEEKSGEAAQKLKVEMRKLSVTNGSLHYIDRHGLRTLAMEQIHGHLLPVDGDSRRGAGPIEVASLILAEKVLLSNVRAQIDVLKPKFAIEWFEAEAYGGNVRGSARVQIEAKGRPFELQLEASGIDAKSLVTAAGDPERPELGRIQMATFAGTGSFDRISYIEGDGHMVVGPINTRGVPFVGRLLALIGVPTLDDLHFSQFAGVYRIRDEKVEIEAARSFPVKDKVSIIIGGTVDFEGRLNIKGEATISSGLAGLLNKVIKTALLKGTDGFATIPFTVRGTIVKPDIQVSVAGLGETVVTEILDLIPFVPISEMTESPLRKRANELLGQGDEVSFSDAHATASPTHPPERKEEPVRIPEIERVVPGSPAASGTKVR